MERVTPEGMSLIPAMTNETERLLYYRLAKENANKGAVVELGAWLGASSAYIAAGMRDSGTAGRAHVYDRFLSKPVHAEKVKAFHAEHGGEPGELPMGDCLPQFKNNLGPLLDYLVVHKGEIDAIKWADDKPIAVLISDAPKRAGVISSVLTAFASALRPGALMAWQDFCHFPSYEIPACLSKLGNKIEFVEATVPGSTLCFRVREQWKREDVTRHALNVSRWKPDKILRVWQKWLPVVPEGKRALFMCGAALFMCDVREPEAAKRCMAEIIDHDLNAVLPKWKYLKRVRPDLSNRYRPLLEMLPC